MSSGLDDFWRVYERHYDAITQATRAAVAANPEMAALMQNVPPAQLEARSQESRLRLRAAVDGDWGPYERDLRQQGAAYAKLGLRFAAWYDVVGAVKRFMVPLLVDAYGSDGARLTAALGALLALVDRTMTIIGEEYFETKEQLIAAQREIAERSIERYRLLFDGSPVPTWVYDRETLAFLAVNRATVAHYGYSEAELLGMTIEDLRFHEDPPRPHAEPTRDDDSGPQDIGEWRHRRKDGSAIFVELHVQAFTFAGRPAHLVVATDVTGRRFAEQVGRFFTLSLDYLCVAGVDGYFKRVNPAFAALGYEEEELLSRPFLDFVHPDDRAATLAEIERESRGQRTVRFENRYVCKDGSVRELMWTSVPDENGNLYAAARDITERKRAEKAKRDFLAMMSHELRTPLNSIIGFSEVLIDGKFGPLTQTQARYLGNVYQSGCHLLGLINDLLDLSKIEAGRLEFVSQPCAPRTVAAEAVVTLQPQAEAQQIRVTLDPPTAVALPPVRADAARFKQVLYNLLANAIKFTRAGGRVGVGCALAPGGRFVRISVKDEGGGISEADRKRLFTPFTQLANAKDRGGTGLGLALTKQLVEGMQGRIGIESEPGRGSEFWFELPVDEGVQPAARGAPVASPTAPLALVVDDDAEARELLLLSLQGAGFRAVAVAGGEEALALARREQPDVITLDVFLPTIDGWDVLERIKADPATANIPVVMVSISNDRAKAFSLGAIEHLVKPVARETLLEALARRSFTTRVKSGPIHVLAVDDDEKQLELYRAALEPHGFVVRLAASGSAGLEAASSGPVDLVLLDLVMPDLSGVEVVSRLRADPKTRAVPILLVTAHQLGAEERARLNGDVVAVVKKGTMRVPDLLDEIARVVRAPR